MANQEGAGGRIFGIISPPRERSTAPVLPRPDVRPAPVSPEPGKPPKFPEKQEGKSSKKAFIARLATTLLAIAGTGGPALDHHINNEPEITLPAIGRDISSIPGFYWNLGKSAVEDIRGLLQKETPISPTFDKTAEKQVIQAGVNTVAVSETELKMAYEAQSAQNKDGRPTVIFPVKFTKDGQNVEYAFQAPLRGFKDSQTGQEVIIERHGSINVTPSKNEEISIPAENTEVFQVQPEVIDGKEYFVGVFIKWQENGETYGLRIGSADVRAFKSLGDVANAPVVPTRQQGGLDLSEAKNGLKFPLGTSLARIDLSNPDVYLNFDRYNPKTGRWESIRPNFVTDNSTGQTKLMLPQ